MEDRVLRPALMLAIVGVMLIGATFASSRTGAAQPGNGLWCRDARYDYDHDGFFTKADLNTWFDITRANGCLYSEVGGANNCEPYDLDGNKLVDDEDVAVAHAVFMACIRPATDNGR